MIASLLGNLKSFRAALLLYVVMPMVLALGLFGYLGLRSIEQQVEVQMQKDLELVARAVRLPVSYALEKGRMGSVQQALESVLMIGRVYSAYVYDEGGNEIMTFGITATESERERLTELAADGQRRGEYDRVAGRQVYSYFVPLTDTVGRINGLLRLTRKESEFIENLNAIRIYGAITLLLLLLLLAIVVFIGHHRALGRHLDRLSNSMARVGRGEREHRFSSRGPREIVTLGDTFNRMLDSIDEAERIIVEHRQQQDRLLKRLRRQEKLAALGRLAAGTAHELGSPLSVIKGRAQRALRVGGTGKDPKSSLAIIQQEVDRMERIIQQLLDFSRRNPLRCVLVDPGYLATSAVDSVMEETGATRDRFIMTGFENTEPIRVDMGRVQQALSNLLRNAVQCSASGTVHLSWHKVDVGGVFWIDDDGPGVPPADRSRIFEPFYTTKAVGEGTGLGLSVVLSVAEEHGGSVDVENSELGGASFRLWIPSQDSTEARNPQ
jgi:two-component system, NtrC family, sensor kinase